MKATLTFTLPDEREEFEVAQNGGFYLSVIQEAQNRIRSVLKHGNPSDEVVKELEELRMIMSDVD